MERSKKDLKEEYKLRRPDMGVFEMRCTETGERFLQASKDIQADINSITFKLDSGYYPNRGLLELWKKYGRDGFEIKTLELLEYKDDINDYTEDLEFLRDMYLEKDPESKKVWK